MTNQPILWAAFSLLIIVCLAIDLGLGRKRTERMSVREAGVWSAVWISLACVFATIVGVLRGWDDAVLFMTGYLVEKALSVDNMFVFILVFSYFAVRECDQPRVLKFGIVGALFFRGALILVGAQIVEHFHWVLYLFALLLIWAGYKMLTHGDEQFNPEDNAFLKLTRRFLPIVNRYDGGRFFTREGGKLYGTALLTVLVVIESTDVVFALDSIPAIFAITNDVFIVFTSNVMAILGLRALFFVLAGVMDMFRFLKVGVAGILFFIAAKMLLDKVVHISPPVSLCAIGVILLGSIIASLAIKPPPPVLTPQGGKKEN